MNRGVSVEVHRLTKRFGTARAVADISFTVVGGSCFTLLGPSGSGKTTLLRLIAGFEEPDQGQIIIDGRDVTGRPAHKRNIGVVFQHFALFPHMTVAQNIAYPLEVRSHSRRQRGDLVEKTLALVRLSGLAGRYPSQLSGGQQQRVALARALVFEPQLLLMDEPLSALDRRLRETMQVEVRHLQQRLGITTITVTHDQIEAMVMSDTIALLDGGVLQQLGPPLEVYRRPANRYVAGFIGESNLIEGSASALDGERTVFTSDKGLSVRVARQAGQAASGRGFLVIRPEAVAIDVDASPTANRYAAEILEVIYFGDLIKYRLGLESGDEIHAKALPGADSPRLAAGRGVSVAWDSADCLIVQE